MSDRLPPLTALRAFDAAARHMSFQRAAAELNVTPAALSFQIKSLEQHLGAPLFRRLNRAVELTEAGHALAPGAADGFRSLTAAWRAARRTTDNPTLTVTAGPAFIAKWLAPRLYDFARDHPEIELRLAASLRMMDFARDEVDVALRFGYGPDPELYEHPFLSEWLTPMMTPDLARAITTPAGLADAALLHQDDIRFLDPPCDWPAWFRAAGLPPRDWTGPRFSQADHAIDAALAGGGVVLGRRSLTAQYLADGRLVAPFQPALSTRAHFRFLCQKGAESRPQIAAFESWLMRETARFADIDSGRTIVPVTDIPG
jgi:LysR family glycine cleavage system transcriptional activator